MNLFCYDRVIELPVTWLKQNLPIQAIKEGTETLKSTVG